MLAFTAAILAMGVAAQAGDEEFKKLENFQRGDFDDKSIVIDNPWWPMKPGMQYIYEGFTVEDDEKIDHRIIFTVTDLTKVVDGVRAVVVFDRDYSDGRLEESELTFFAQDKHGNVWHLGQHREMYDEKEFVGARTWVVGHTPGAQAGIMMKATPKLGESSYSQGYAPPPFNWTDRARVKKLGETTSVRAGTYDNVLVIEEYNAEEPGAFQLKYHASGVGLVGVGWDGDDDQQEELQLVKVVELDANEMAKIRSDAMELEKRALVYSTMPPAEAKPTRSASASQASQTSGTR